MRKFSKMMLGTVQFGLDYGIANKEGRPTLERVKEILQAAADAGVDTLDTAAAYGSSEETLGRALAETQLADRFRIITKTPVLPIDCDEKTAESLIRASLQESLRRLRREKVTAVLIHNERNIPFFPILERIAAEGFADGAGLSLDSSESLTKYPETVERARFVQLPSNLLDRRFDALIDSAPTRGTAVFARSACLQGLLLLPTAEIPATLAALIPWRERLERIARDADVPLKELCFRYLISLEGVTSVVFGVDNREQVLENTRYAKKGPLAESVVAAIRSEIPLLDERLIRPHLWTRQE